MVPFGGAPADAAASLGGIKVAGDAALSTLIYQNMTDGMARLKDRKEPRKAVLLLTDGKDETPGGAPAQEIAKKKLIQAAIDAGVVLHAVGYAETAAEQGYFAALKELAAATDGLFVAAGVATKELPAETAGLLSGVMHGAGIAHLDLSKLAKPADVVLSIKTAMDRVAELKIPEKEVEATFPPPPPPPPPTPPVVDPTPAPPEPPPPVAAPQEDPAPKEDTDKKDAEDKAKRKTLMLVGGGVVALLALVAVLMVRASRKRAAETARWEAEAEEARQAEEAQRAEAVRLREAEAKKAETKPLAWLEMCDAQQTRHAVKIPNLKIGRGQHNDLVLRNDSVSGNHCVLNCTREGQWSVTDLNSGNGVLVNGERIVQAPLRHGDVIELGELKMRFLLHV